MVGSAAGLQYIAQLLGLNANPMMLRGLAGLLNPSTLAGPQYAAANVGASVVPVITRAFMDRLVATMTGRSTANMIPLTALAQGIEMVGSGAPLMPGEAELMFPRGEVPASFGGGLTPGTALGALGTGYGLYNLATSDAPAPVRAVQGAQTALGSVNTARSISPAFDNLAGDFTTNLGDAVGLGSGIPAGVSMIAPEAALTAGEAALMFPGGSIPASFGGAAPAAVEAPAAVADVGGGLGSLGGLGTSLASAGAGFAGTKGGTMAAEAAFGPSTEQGYGSMAGGGAGAAGGAAVGTALLPGIGTVLGALVGGVAGALGGGGIGSIWSDVSLSPGGQFRRGLSDVVNQVPSLGNLQVDDENFYNMDEEKFRTFTPQAQQASFGLGHYLSSFLGRYGENKGEKANDYGIQASNVLLNNLGDDVGNTALGTFQSMGVTDPRTAFQQIADGGLQPDQRAPVWQSLAATFGQPDAPMPDFEGEASSQQQTALDAYTGVQGWSAMGARPDQTALGRVAI